MSEVERSRPILSNTWLPEDVLREVFISYVNNERAVDVPFLPMQEEDYSVSSYWDNIDNDDSDYSPSVSSSYWEDIDDDDGNYPPSEPDEVSSLEGKPLVDLPLPLVLSHVCSAWRHTALSTLQLWSNVCIATFDPHSKRLAAEWLSKAGTCPVSITIYEIVSGPEAIIYDDLREFLSAYHIKSLELPLLSQTLPRLQLLLTELPVEKIACLETLSLTDLENGHQDFLFLDSTRYPCLRDLELLGHFVGDSIVLPWTTLRYLDTRAFYLPTLQCLDILRECVSLEACLLGISSPHEQGSVVGDVHVPSLREFTIAFSFPANIGDFFRLLTIPHLNVLTVDKHRRTGAELRWSDEEYSRMIQRSNCPLHHLTILRSDLVDVYNVLHSSPMLTAKIHRALFRQETLDHLATGQLAPLLQRFYIGVVRGVPSSAFKEMISLRAMNSESVAGAERRLMPLIFVHVTEEDFQIPPPLEPPVYYFPL
jgi:predicted nucleic acid-binding protein